MTIDAWMQHPTRGFLTDDMLASLRRWTGGGLPDEIPDVEVPIEATLAAMDSEAVDIGLLSAWRGPNGLDLVSNDEVAGWVRAHPDRLAGLAAVDLERPMEAVHELRRRVNTTRRLPPELVTFMKTGTGQRKVLFGTNYPMIAHGHALDGLDELGLSESARHDYLHANAVEVFPTLEEMRP